MTYLLRQLCSAY